MLSLNSLPPNISFNFPHSPSLSTKPQTLRTTSYSAKLNTHFSHRNPSSDNQPLKQSLYPSQLAIWLRSCRCIGDVKKLHLVIIRRFRDQNTYLLNNLICVYLKFGCLNDARNVFDEMSQRNVVTWTAIINGYLSFDLDEEAMSLFVECVEIGIRPNEKMFTCALNLCSKRTDIELGRQLHGGVAKSGRSNVIVESSVVKLYAQCGDLQAGFCAFDRMASKDVVTWTTMITACAQQGRGGDALGLFSRMVDEGFSPNEFTLCGVLKACGEEKVLRFGRQLHCAVVKKLYSIVEDVFVGTSIVDMYAKCGEIMDSRSVFDRMRHRNTATWTAIIAGYAREDGGEEALRLFRDMAKHNVFANNLTVVSVARACGAIRAWMTGRELHARIVKMSKIESNVPLGSTLVWFYCRCGSYNAAARVLQWMPIRDVVSWTALISGCAALGMESEALEVLRAMVEDGIEPNSFTFSSALKACARLEAGLHGRLIHSTANKMASAVANVFVSSALINMYASCGRVEDASRVFHGMPERNLVAWKSMIVGYAKNGMCREALKLMYRMKAEGFEVDDYVNTTVLDACGDIEIGAGGPAKCELQYG